MKFKTYIIFTILLFGGIISAQDELSYKDYIDEAYKLYKEGKYGLSLEMYEKAYTLDNTNIVDLYNGSCSAALSNQPEKAITLMNQSINNGYHNADHLQKDSDLYSLHPLPEWKLIVEKIKQKDQEYLSESKILDIIFNAVKSDDLNHVWDICSDEYKQTINQAELSKTIHVIHDLLQNRGIKSVSDLRSSSNSSTTYKSGIKTAKYKKEYYYYPNYLGPYTPEMFIKNPGGIISVELIESNNKWYLNNLVYSDNYYPEKSNGITDIEYFFSNPGKSLTMFAVIRNNKRIMGIADSIKISMNEFKNCFVNLEYIGSNDIPDLNEMKNAYSISFLKEIPRKASHVDPDNIFSSVLSNKTQIYLQIGFFDIPKQVILLSNGENYGFFKTDDLSYLKNLIFNELTLQE